MILHYLGLFIIFLSFTYCAPGSESLSQSSQSGRIVASPTPPSNNRVFEEQSPDLQILSSEKVPCGESEYKVERVNNILRKAFDVRIVNTSSGAKQTIQMPNQSEYNGFALNWAKATERGFELSIEWGTRIHHDMKFSFACRDSRFILAAIKHDTFDSHFPEDTKKYRTRKPAAKHDMPFEKFVITDFMVD